MSVRGGTRHDHYGHGITKSRHGCSSASIPRTILIAFIALVTHYGPQKAYFRRLAFSPSLLHKKRRRTIQTHNRSGAATRKQPARRDKSKVWLLNNRDYAPDPLRSCSDTHARMNMAIDNGESSVQVQIAKDPPREEGFFCSSGTVVVAW
jgi:hypothetical protein